MGDTKTGKRTSDNWTVFGAVPATLQTENFKLTGDNDFFNIDNENDDDIWLTIRLANMTTFEEKRIRQGYNPLLIAEIQADGTLTTDQISKLKWGY